MVIVLNPGKMIIVFLKILMYISLSALVSSLVIFPIININENNQKGVRKVEILNKIDNGYYLKFKVKDLEIGNKFSITPTRSWYNSMEIGDITTTNASVNDTRIILHTFLNVTFIIDIILLIIGFIFFCINIPDMITRVNKEIVLDLRSKKTKQKELTLKELEKTPEFKTWRKDYEKALVEVEYSNK